MGPSGACLHSLCCFLVVSQKRGALQFQQTRGLVFTSIGVDWLEGTCATCLKSGFYGIKKVFNTAQAAKIASAP